MDRTTEHSAEHQHHGHHGHGEEPSLSERNRAHWDKQAATYMSENFQKEFGNLLNKVTAFILSNISWIGVDFLDPAETFEAPSPGDNRRRVRVLDYACGPGTITSALAGYATEYIGIDLSENMVAEYNKRLSNAPSNNGPNSQSINAKAVTGNLLAPDDPAPESLSGPEFTNFDLVAVGLGFHHFDHLDQVMQRLVHRLKPNGTLMIVDFLPHAKNDIDRESSVNTVAHHGFSEHRVRSLFTGAALVDVDLRILDEPVMLRGKAPRTVFIARGKKRT